MKGFKIAKFGVLFITMAALFVFIMMSLWNWLMPEIFGLPTLTFWQAAGLLLLTKILFGFRGGKKFNRNHHGPPWRNHWKQKWANMTPDQQERWKKNFADKWCSRPHDEEKTEE